ncbi:MAG: Crp/Fnr family transcriptional regulator [Anaerolineae bacterium]
MDSNLNKNSLLRAVPYFARLTDAELELVAVEVIERKYRGGELIFLEEADDAGLHLVVGGVCKIYRLSEEGREHILTLLKPGDSCNEVPVIDVGPNPANLAAVEDSVVWVITADSLNNLRRQIPSLNDAIIRSLAMRCRQLVKRVYSLTFLPVTGRLAAFLLEQSNENSELSRKRWTHDEIAAHLGTVREMVGRAFKDLQQSGLISIDRHRVEIVDREGLEKLT